MFSIKQLILRDFMSFKELTLDFKNGLYLIQGFNSRGGDSNGAGKTAILSGITWCLFGRTQTGAQGSTLCRWGTNECVGILTLEGNEHTYKILRTSSSLEFFIDSIKQDGQKRELQSIINSTFGTDYNKFTTFNIFSQTWSRFITEVSDADRKKLFKDVLQLNRIDKAYEQARGLLNHLKSQANSLELTINNLVEQLNNANQELEKYKELAANESSIKQKAIEEFETRKRLLEPPAHDYRKDLDEIEAELSKFNQEKIAAKLSDLEQQLTNITTAFFAGQQFVEEYDRRIEEFLKATGTGYCPTCGQLVNEKHRVGYNSHLQTIRNKYKEQVSETRRVKETLEEEIFSLQQILSNIKELQEKQRSIEMQLWQQMEATKKYQDYCAFADEAIARLNSSIVNYESLIEQKQLVIQQLSDKLEANKDQLKHTLNDIDIYNYLVWLYSRQGVVNVIIARCFDRLKFLANKFLSSISQEGFKIDISKQKSLKSGDIRDEIDIFVVEGSRRIPYQVLSAGQQQRVNLALMFAMYMWGREIGCNNFNFLLLDEICDLSLGEKGQQDVVTILQRLRRLVGQIFIITHKSELAGQYDHTITITRNDKGISSLLEKVSAT